MGTVCLWGIDPGCTRAESLPELSACFILGTKKGPLEKVQIIRQQRISCQLILKKPHPNDSDYCGD